MQLIVITPSGVETQNEGGVVALAGLEVFETRQKVHIGFHGTLRANLIRHKNAVKPDAVFLVPQVMNDGLRSISADRLTRFDTQKPCKNVKCCVKGVIKYL